MRIAVYHDLPSGGAKRSLWHTLERLHLKHHTDVYTLSTADESFCDLRPFAKHYQVFPFAPSHLFHSPFGRLNQLQRWRDLMRLDALSRQVACEIDSQGYDVVFAQPCMWTQAPLLLRHLRTPAVYYCQEPPRAIYESELATGNDVRHWRTALDRVDPLISLYRLTARRLDWESTRSAQTVLVNSKFMRDTVSRIYSIAPRICYHGVDTTCFYPMPNVAGQDYVLSVGAIAPTKGFDFLVKSIGSLPEASRPPLKLVGNVEREGERQRLEHLAWQYAVNLSFEIGVDQETLVRRYNQAALVAYAPHNEPFGLVPLEAMACGTLVIGVGEGGVRETIIDGVTGVIVDRNPQKMADALASALSCPEKAGQLGRQGREYVQKNWTWDRPVATLENELTRVAKD